MKKAGFILVCLAAYVNVAFCQITISSISPLNNGLTDDSLTVTANISSVYSLDSVTATVSNITVILTPVSANVLSGKIFLGGLPQDTLLLTIWAKDLLNNTATATRNFIYDQKPKIYVDSPGYSSVARPLIQFKAQVVDSLTNNCPGVLSVISPGPIETIATFVGAIDTVIDLSKWNGKKLTLRCVATDSKNQTVTKILPSIDVEASPYLAEIYKGQYPIVDFQGKRMLAYEPSPTNTKYKTPWIIDLNANSLTMIPFKGDIITGKVTTSGAVFGAIDSTLIAAAIASNQTTTSSFLYGWSNNVIQTVPQSGFNQYLAANFNNAYSHTIASGDFVAWHNTYQGLYKLFMPTFSDSIVSSFAGNNNFDITSTGTVVFWGGLNSYTEFDVIMGQSGILTKVTNDNAQPFRNIYPETDGVNILYVKQLPVPPYTMLSLYHYDGNNHSYLSDRTSGYQVENGFIGYLKDDAGLVPQIHVKSPSGTDYTYTIFGTGTRTINQLSDGGGVMYLNSLPSSDPKLYYADSLIKTGPLASQLGAPYYFSGEWFLTIAGNLYKINIDTTSLSIGNIQKSTFTSTSLSFTSNDFKSTFSQPGHPVVWKLKSSPANGTLSLKTKVLQTGDSLFGGQINDLTYKSQSGYTGADSFMWSVFDGYRYSINDAYVYINVQPLSVKNFNQSLISALILPNPSEDHALLQIKANHSALLKLTIIDITGKIVWEQYIQKDKGGSSVSLPTSLISSGVYILKLQGVDEAIRLKWIKK